MRLTAQVGVRKARQLAAEHELRLVPVHHMEAHALVRPLGTLHEDLGQPCAAANT